MNSHPLRRLMLLALLFCLPLHNTHAGDDERIQAVAEFLIERAEANLIYSFENRLKKDEELKCYFPATYAHIMQGNLRILISARGEWQRALESDIDTLMVRAVAHELVKGLDLSSIGMTATNDFLEAAEFIDLDGYPLNSMPVGATPEQRQLINGFYSDFLKLREELQEIDNMLAGFAGDDPCTMPVMSSADFKAHVEKLSAAIEGMKGLSTHIEKHGGKLRFDKARLSQACAADPRRGICELRDKALHQWLPTLRAQLNKPLVKVSASLVVLALYIKETEGQDYTSRVLRAMELLEKGGMNKQKLARLKNNVLFFARLADARTKEEAKAVLQEYTLPPVSFMIKRQPPGGAHWLLSSYFAYAGGLTLDGPGKDKAYQGMFVPVGLEYSRALNSGASMSLMLAPFDFGYPVSMQLNGSDLGVGVDQVVAPSVSLTYGFADYPLAMGLSLQQGRDVGNGDSRENRAMLFFAFDMPLLQLY